MPQTTIGIAGYMGSGKTTCTRLLAKRGWTVIEADPVAKQLMNGDETIRRRIAERFGEDVVDASGIRSDLLGQRAFADLEALQELNAIVHPPLLRKLERLVQTCPAEVCVLDAALIPCWRIEAWFDTLCWVAAPRPLRQSRLAALTRLDPDQLQRRMELQEALFEQPAAAPWRIIDNSGDLAGLGRAVEEFCWTGRAAC